MRHTLVRTLIAMSVATNALADSAPPDGIYDGMLVCEAAESPREPSFSAPASIKVAGTRATWLRETPVMREVVSASLSNGHVSFDGFGGSVSAATRQAFWDWRFKANLAYTSQGFSGDAQMLSKDGRDVLRHCTFAQNPGATVTSAPAPVPAMASSPVLAANPSLHASTPPTNVDSAPMISTPDLTAREEALRKKEEALAKREQLIEQREQRGSVPNMTTPPALPSANGLATPVTPGQGSVASVSPSSSEIAGLAGTAVQLLAGAAVEGAKQGAFAQRGRTSATPLAVLQTIQQQVRANQPQSDSLPSLPVGMTNSVRPSPGGGSIAWPTKAALLSAARKGEFVPVKSITYYGDAQFAPLLRSISYVLASEYGVPSLPADAQGCRFQYNDNVLALARAINGRHLSTLSDRPPTFYSPPSDSGPSPEDLIRRVNGSVNCDTEILGMRRSHPYKQALIQLMGEFGQATKDYVDAERSLRQTAYQQQKDQALAEQNRQRDEQARYEAAARAAAQRRIDAERARIEADEKRRQDIERSRIGG